MKILQISSGVIETPPLNYGGLEAVVSDLAVELGKAGHKVCVVATADSKIGNIHENVDLWDCGEKDPNAHKWEWEAYQKIKDRLNEFDIIHDHSWLKAIYSDPNAKKLPLVATCHGMPAYQCPPPVPYPSFIGLSRSHAELYSGCMKTPFRFAYNGIDLDKYEYKEKKGDRILFLARITSLKGAHNFIDIIKQTEFEADMVGDDVLVEDRAYVDRILDSVNLLDGRISYWGQQSRERCVEFFQNAKCYIMPLTPPWSEPFGLTVIESMACGTPVIATPNGSMPELIVHGVSGFICGIDEIPAYIGRIDEIDPADCRRRAEMFSRERMCQKYLQLYSEKINRGGW